MLITVSYICFHIKEGAGVQMNNEILVNLTNALYGVVATAIIVFFKDRIFELYNSTFYGKLLDENKYKKSHKDFYYTPMNELGKVIPIENIRFHSLDNKYRMNEQIPSAVVYERIDNIFKFYKLYCKVKGIQLFNGRVARLNNFKIDGDEIKIETQELEYFDYIKSHLIGDAFLRNFYHFKYRNIHKTFREYVNSKPELYLRLARTLGINILVVTKDSKIIMQQRSKNTNIYGGTTYPSASGSLEHRDAISFSCIRGSMKKIILGRELFEEISVFPTDIRDIGLIGIYEDHYRLRLPDMFFIAIIDSSFDEVKVKYEKDRSKDKFETAGITGIDVDDFYSQDEKKLSQPLRVYYNEKEIITKYLKEKQLL